MPFVVNVLQGSKNIDPLLKRKTEKIQKICLVLGQFSIYNRHAILPLSLCFLFISFHFTCTVKRFKQKPQFYDKNQEILFEFL